MSNYFDYLKRLHTKPIRPDDEFPTNNAWIYTGIYETLRQMNGKSKEIGYYDLAVLKSRVSPDTYTRHPEPYRFKPSMTPISHDEIIGLAMVDYYEANHIAAISQVNEGYFCDIPFFEQKLKFSFLDKVIALYLYLYRVLVKKESERKITKQYPALFGLFFSHRRQYRYLYEALAKNKPHLLNTLAWASGRLIDVLTNSVSPLHYFSSLRAEQRGHSGFLFNTVLKLMKRSIMKKYKTRPIQGLLVDYLLDGTGSVDKNHPWLIEITEYYGNKGE